MHAKDDQVNFGIQKTIVAKMFAFRVDTFVFCLLVLNSFWQSYTATALHTDLVLKQNQDMKDAKHGIKMGLALKDCDDAETNLEVDWDNSPINYTCYQNTPYEIDAGIKTIVECEPVPDGYMPQHYCMKDAISYNHSLPTHGDHRPLWPIFGEYLYVPVQRWLHNVEHGAIIMIYHPCAHPMMVGKLRKLVTSCIRKHIITPDAFRVAPERPLALVTWGCRMTMNHVNTHEVINFIRKHALNGPEGTYAKEGQYGKNLLRKAKVPVGSSFEDDILCPFSF